MTFITCMMSTTENQFSGSIANNAYKYLSIPITDTNGEYMPIASSAEVGKWDYDDRDDYKILYDSTYTWLHVRDYITSTVGNSTTSPQQLRVVLYNTSGMTIPLNTLGVNYTITYVRSSAGYYGVK